MDNNRPEFHNNMENIIYISFHIVECTPRIYIKAAYIIWLM